MLHRFLSHIAGMLVAFLLAASPAHAQTRSALNAQLLACFPDQVVGFITPLDMRTCLSSLLIGNNFATANVVSFGADPSGVADSTAAINSAIASFTNSCATLYFPRGTYKINSQITASIGLNCSFTILGDGQSASILNWPNAAGGISILLTDKTASVHVRDISFVTGQAGGGDALKLSSTAGAPTTQDHNDVYRVSFHGNDGFQATNYWTNGINAVGVSFLQVEGAAFFGNVAGNGGNGINFAGVPASTLYAVVLNVAKSDFNSTNNGIVYGSYVQGVTVDQSNFTGGQNGIISAGAETGVLQQLSVSNSQFLEFGSGAIVASTVIGQLMLVNNLISVVSPAVLGISAPAANTFVQGNYISCNSGGASTGINMTAGSGGTISNNIILTCTTGIKLAAATQLIQVENNLIALGTTAVTNLGTSNVIVNSSNGGTGGPMIDNGSAGSTSLLAFADAGVNKWWVGKQSDNTFIVYDFANAVTAHTIIPGAIGAGFERINYTTASTSSTTGALVISGGLGVAGAVNTAAAIKSTSATGGIGYTTGAGCSIGQTVNRSQGVTCTGVTGQITGQATSLGTGAEAVFTVTNTSVALNDTVILSVQSGPTANTSVFSVSRVAAGSFDIKAHNLSGTTADTGAPIINFTVMRGSAS